LLSRIHRFLLASTRNPAQYDPTRVHEEPAMIDPRIMANALQEELPAILSMTERVVNIDSGTYHAAGVNAVIDVWAEFLRNCGFDVSRDPLSGRGDQMTARRILGEGRRVLVLGHADTVWPAGTVAEWPFQRDGDWITGPGAGDMKSCVVMALHAIRQVLRDPPAGIGSITVLAVPDEEIGSPGSRSWIEDEARRADLCLTMEPCRPGGGVVVGRGAVGALYIRAKGVSAHTGSSRDQGASAIAALAPMVVPLEALTDAARGISATVGLFRGGSARQVVPSDAEIHLDLRGAETDGAALLLTEARRIASIPPAEVEGDFYRPAFPTRPGTRALYARAQAICAELGAPIREVVSPGGSDGSFAAGLGIPTLDGLGPITHETCSRRERVEVSSIASRGALLATLIADAGPL
jgi:glutamate carboxypeptidase